MEAIQLLNMDHITATQTTFQLQLNAKTMLKRDGVSEVLHFNNIIIRTYDT